MDFTCPIGANPDSQDLAAVSTGAMDPRRTKNAEPAIKTTLFYWQNAVSPQGLTMRHQNT